jgi:hypothetical protein
MSLALYLAAVLLVLVGVAHSYLGERFILIRLFRRADLPRLFGGTQFTTRTLRFAWHITTLAWWGFAAILVQLAQGPVSRRGIALAIGFTFLATALAVFAGSRGRHLAWPVFLLIGGLALLSAS